MSYTLCYKLLPLPGSIVGHGFEESADSFLVSWRDGSVLCDQRFLFGGKKLSKRCRTPARQHKRCIYPTFLKCRHISKVERVRAQLIVFLSPPTHPKAYSKLCLIQS